MQKAKQSDMVNSHIYRNYAKKLRISFVNIEIETLQKFERR